jgi:hypothetical protein
MAVSLKTDGKWPLDSAWYRGNTAQAASSFSARLPSMETTISVFYSFMGLEPSCASHNAAQICWASGYEA